MHRRDVLKLGTMAAVTAAFGIPAQGADFNTVRKDKIAAVAARFTGSAPYLFIGDSHVQNMGMIFGDGFELESRPAVFAGIAGGTVPILTSYIPWAVLAAMKPFKVFVMFGINDAKQGVGFDHNGNYNDGVASLMQFLSRAAALAPSGSMLIASDPPPEQAAGIDAYRTHQMARMLYYMATLPWSGFGWTGAQPPQPIPFSDVMSKLALAGGTPASEPMNVPCYLDPPDSIDQVHLTHEAYLRVLNTLMWRP